MIRNLPTGAWYKTPGASKEMIFMVDLPALSGTEKQIAWAETIRDRVFASLILGAFHNFGGGEYVGKTKFGETKLRENKIEDAAARERVSEIARDVAAAISRPTSGAAVAFKKAGFWIETYSHLKGPVANVTLTSAIERGAAYEAANAAR